MKSLLKALNPAPKPVRKIHTLRFTDEEWQEIQKRANELAAGNVSAYLRHAGLNYRPKKSELEK